MNVKYRKRLKGVTRKLQHLLDREPLAERFTHEDVTQLALQAGARDRAEAEVVASAYR